MPKIEDSELKRAPNFEAILEWVDKNRPDCSDHIRDIMTACHKQNPNGDAMALLLVFGFSAGRAYQHKYPNLNPNFGYHR